MDMDDARISALEARVAAIEMRFNVVEATLSRHSKLLMDMQGEQRAVARGNTEQMAAISAKQDQLMERIAALVGKLGA